MFQKTSNSSALYLAVIQRNIFFYPPIQITQGLALLEHSSASYNDAGPKHFQQVVQTFSLKRARYSLVLGVTH